MLLIDRAAQRDAETILGIKAAGWRSTYSSWVDAETIEAVATDLSSVEGTLDHDLVWLARDAGHEGLGFAHVVTRERETPLLESLHVLPSARGRGVGSSLLAAVGREIGEGPLDVHVVRENSRALALYQRLGAHVTAVDQPAPWAPSTVREVHLRWPQAYQLVASRGA